jgi:DNA-binding transcriptional MerR regulator
MERLGISRRTLYRWGELGLITTWKVGGSNRYDVAELDRMITRRVAS